MNFRHAYGVVCPIGSRYVQNVLISYYILL